MGEELACGRYSSVSCRHSAKLVGIDKPTTRRYPSLSFFGPRDTISSNTSILNGDLLPCHTIKKSLKTGKKRKTNKKEKNL